MKVIIIAGGLGTRISEETEDKPKPMVLINNKPIIWHLMNIFSSQGHNDFILALGYRSDVIKRWLLDLNELDGNITINTATKKVHHRETSTQYSWNVTALETGLNTQTGGRIAQCMRAFPGERVIATYGDGLANVSIDKLLNFHESHGKLATVTTVRPLSRFGVMDLDSTGQVQQFREKPQTDDYVNAGFFVFEPQVLDYLDEECVLEQAPLERLAAEGQLMAYRHEGFWQPMDTYREFTMLNEMWDSGNAPWKVWE